MRGKGDVIRSTSLTFSHVRAQMSSAKRKKPSSDKPPANSPPATAAAAAVALVPVSPLVAAVDAKVYELVKARAKAVNKLLRKEWGKTVQDGEHPDDFDMHERVKEEFKDYKPITRISKEEARKFITLIAELELFSSELEGFTAEYLVDPFEMEHRSVTEGLLGVLENYAQ